jgi:hypothetical protein
MKPHRTVFVVFLLALIPLAAMAQSSQEARANLTVEPPPLHSALAGTRANAHAVISSLLAPRAEIPLGPLDVLKKYENGMTAIAERISSELSTISLAVRAGQITREQADYLTQETYERAMMQYEVLCTLHDSLEHDVLQAETLSKHPLRR